MRIPIVIILLSSLLIGCGFFGEKRDEVWFMENFQKIIQIKGDVESLNGLNYVSLPWKGNSYKEFDHEPTKVEIDKYTEIYSKMKSLGIQSVSIDRKTGSMDFITYEAGVFGDIHQSYDFVINPDSYIKIIATETWRCKQTSIQNWYVCEEPILK
ncbi:hypothetical protein EOPP23_19535 [Endozoicomonas sp. OPT23]|nr:hypothetical protein [Endozoicomonas sp. OPT23]